MKKIQSFFEKWGLHAFLLPVFFITHNYQQYYGLVSTQVAIRSGLVILLFILFAFALLFGLTKQVNKSLQLVTLFAFVFLFFGVIKDFLQSTLHAPFLSKYSVLLPLLTILTILLAWMIVKKKDFRRNNLFQNSLLLLFLLIDFTRLWAFDASTFLNKNLLVENNYHIKPASPVVYKPDVYYLVFDCYPGSGYLRKFMQFDNSEFDKSLLSKGFHIVQNSKSNYNRTAFSIAATLNFQYLKGIENDAQVTPEQYNHALLTINSAEVVQTFKKNNYKFFNLSIFDIDDNKPIYKESFLSLSEESVLLHNTLLQRIKNDILWNFLTNKNYNWIGKKIFEKENNKNNENVLMKKEYNQKVKDSLLKIPLQKTTSSKFIYAHFYLPHPPFFFNEKGKEYDLNYISNPKSFRNKSLFLSYLQYTNSIVLEICNKLIQTSSKKPVIILESDHGFTDFEGGPSEKSLYFKNYTAIYFPDKNYSTLYDTLSNINTFPILFNKYFNSTIPLQKDSSLFLKD